MSARARHRAICSLATTELVVIPACAPVPHTGSARPAPAAASTPAPVSIEVGAITGDAAVAGGYVYTPRVDGSIAVIDAARAAFAREFRDPALAVTTVHAFPDGEHVLALDARTGRGVVLDPAREDALVQRIDLAGAARGVAFGSDDRTALFASEAGVVGLTFDVDRTGAPVRRPFPEAGAADLLATTAGWLAATAPRAKEIRVLPLDGAAGRTIPMPGVPALIAVAPLVTGAVAVVAPMADLEEAVVATNDGAPPVSVVGVGRGASAAIADPELGWTSLAVPSRGEVVVVDHDNPKVVARIAISPPPHRLALVAARPHAASYALRHGDGLGRELRVTSEAGDHVVVIEAETAAIKGPIAAAAGAAGVVFWGERAFVACRTVGQVVALSRP